jgi:hypothetical protein
LFPPADDAADGTTPGPDPTGPPLSGHQCGHIDIKNVILDNRQGGSPLPQWMQALLFVAKPNKEADQGGSL